jgi:PII-like signaling protein
VREALKLTVYFGVFGRAGLQVSVLLRGLEGYGLAQRLRTQRLLTLSEDLPLVAVAVDERERIEAVVPQVTDLVGAGLVTLERARLLDGAVEQDDAGKLTIYLGRRAGYRDVVEHLRGHGLAGATVLLGVDGTAHGVRRRARFLSRNASVPLMVVSVGPPAAVTAALGGLDAPLATVERVRVCKRDGRLLAEPEAGDAAWHKLTVYAGEQARHRGHPLYVQLVRRLREEGLGGATALRGIWGFSGDHAPHGDRLLALRRRVPVATVAVEAAAELPRLFRVVDEVTDEAGLVTSELVPFARHLA